MAALNQWDTDPYGDPNADATPWMSPSATPPPDVAPPSGDVGGGAPWSEQNPWDAAGEPKAKLPTSAPEGGDTYDAHLSQISQATNPMQQAAAQDDLARQLQTDLEADGHAVKWSGATTLSVDGRDYELGTGGGQGITDPTTADAGGAGGYPSQGGTADLPTVVAQIYRTALGREASPQEIQDTIRGGSGDLATIQQSIYASAEAKAYGAQRTAAAAAGTGTGTTTPAGRMDDAAILAQIAQWAAMDGADPSLAADPNYWLGAIKSRGGLGDDNRQYWQDAGVGPSAFFRNPNREGGATATGGAAGGAGPTSPWVNQAGGAVDPAYPAWSPTAPTYTPNFIDPSASELPNFQDILDLLDTPGAGDAELQKLVQGIVEHPETLTDQDIEMLKARSAEEAAVAGQSQDEELQHFGYNSGLDSSPWLAGQRAQNAWNRSNSTITANRGIDIAAASQRSADRAQAAQIGTAYSSFQSSKKAQAVGLAVTAALGKAGEQRSRTQLNESLKQAATQLGLTKDNLVMTYLGHVMTDLTNNKQIDLNFDVDMKKLAEQSDEFKQTLLQRMHELAQADDQFKANYGLAAQEFQHKKDQDAWERAKSNVA